MRTDLRRCLKDNWLNIAITLIDGSWERVGCPRSRGFRDLGFHRHVKLGIFLEAEESPVAPALETWDRRLNCRPPSTGYRVLGTDFFHHKRPVCRITDFQPAVRHTDDLIGALIRVPVSQDGIEAAPKPILGSSLTTRRSKIAAKSLVLEDFTRNSFKLKDLAGISP